MLRMLPIADLRHSHTSSWSCETVGSRGVNISASRRTVAEPPRASPPRASPERPRSNWPSRFEPPSLWRGVHFDSPLGGVELDSPEGPRHLLTGMGICD